MLHIFSRNSLEKCFCFTLNWESPFLESLLSDSSRALALSMNLEYAGCKRQK